jgi:hypothetical protein
MKKILNISKVWLVWCVFFTLGGCQLFNLDINQDPNNPQQAEIGLLLTQAQYTMADNLAGGTNDNLHGFMGMLSSVDDFNLQNTFYNFFWSQTFAGPLKDIDELIKATEGRNNPHYLGIAQFMKAYYFSTLVDLFGDLPYNQAFDGNAGGNLYPTFDKDKAIYDSCFALIDRGLANVAKTSPVTFRNASDLIYGGNLTKWIKMGNSLKLKLLLQTRKVDANAATKIQAVITAGNLITSAADDFQFQFSNLLNPDNRHPWFQQAYAPESNGFTYILNQYVLEMLRDEDPRLPFYFRRQTDKVLDQANPSERNTTPCSNTVGCTYAYLVLNDAVINELYTAKGITFNDAAKKYMAGFFCRDKGDPAGVPNDTDLRLAPGVYPAGGLYDVTTPKITGNTTTGGNGIFSMISSVNILYYQIESALALGTSGNARTMFEQAIRSHISKVVNLGLSVDSRNAVAPAQTAIDTYVNLWLGRFDNAVSTDSKLNVVMRQLWASSWGNGYEIYNAIRRTGFPNNIQVPINKPRQFALRLPYPQNELTLNPNAPKTPPAFDVEGVFWDVIKYKY